MMRSAIIACLFLAACASTPATISAKPEPVTIVKTVCPPIRTYTADEQKALASAIGTLPDGSPLVGAMLDYGALRKAIKACKP